MAICNIKNINKIVNKENLQICVVSYGSSGSNACVEALEKNGYKCQTKIWHKILCHCPKYIKMEIPVIYIYDNPMKSYLSMKRRGIGYWDENQRKLSNNKNVTLSDDNLFQLMFAQHKSWTKKYRKNVLIVKTCELFGPGIKNKLQSFLGNYNMTNFPIEYIHPKTNIEHIDTDDINLFKKYVKEISEVNDTPLDSRYNFIPFVKKSQLNTPTLEVNDAPLDLKYVYIPSVKKSQPTTLTLEGQSTKNNMNANKLTMAQEFMLSKKSPLLTHIVTTSTSDLNYEKINRLLTSF
jgi:hypothetical protein